MRRTSPTVRHQHFLLYSVHMRGRQTWLRHWADGRRIIWRNSFRHLSAPFGTFRHLSVPFSNLWPHIMRVYTSARHRYKIEQKDKNTHMVMNHHLPCVFFDFYDRCSCAPAHRLVEVLHVTFRVCRRTHYLVTWRGIEPMRHQNRSIRSVALGMRYLNSPDLIELGRGRNPAYI